MSEFQIVKSEAEEESDPIPDDITADGNDGDDEVGDSLPKIELHAHFPSFIVLKKALDRYQKENHIQLIVKDSKLLSAESTRRVIPKVFHLVNQSLMYHSITYCCKCHGVLRQKPGSRIKNIGAKRLNCPMYVRFKLSTDFQSLVLFDLLETHNHDTDPNTYQIAPRQQVYRLSRIQRGEPDPGDYKQEVPDRKSRQPRQEDKDRNPHPSGVDVQALIATAIKDVNSVSNLGDGDYEPPAKTARIKSQPPGDVSGDNGGGEHIDDDEEDEEEEEDDDYDEEDDVSFPDNPDSPLDPDSSCSDSDEEEFRKQRQFLTFPIRLIGSAIRSSPELIALSKELIEAQKVNLLIEKKKLILETQLMELKNAKLSLEVKNLERNLASGSDQSTTFYLQS